MDKFFDFKNPFYDPLWVRLLVVGSASGWGLFEFVSGNHIWGAIFLAAGGIALNGLFLSRPPKDKPDGGDAK